MALVVILSNKQPMGFFSGQGSGIFKFPDIMSLFLIYENLGPFLSYHSDKCIKENLQESETFSITFSILMFIFSMESGLDRSNA